MLKIPEIAFSRHPVTTMTRARKFPGTVLKPTLTVGEPDGNAICTHQRNAKSGKSRVNRSGFDA